MAEQLGYTLTIRTRREGNGAQQAAADVRAFNEELERTQRTQTRTAAATTRATKGTRNLGLATLEASRAFEDAQYGMRGVLNNIPTLLTMLGAGPGLAGVVSAAAVALSILTKEMGQQKEAAKKAADAAEEMRDALQEAYSDEQIDRVNDLTHQMQLLALQQEQVAQHGQRQADIEETRRQNIEAVAKALREAAEVEIKFREARGEISGADAQAQLAMLEGEERAAALQSQLAVRDKQVADAERRNQQSMRTVDALLQEQREKEIQLAQQQAEQAEYTREMARLREVMEGELVQPSDLQKAAAGMVLGPFTDMIVKERRVGEGGSKEQQARLQELELKMTAVEKGIAENLEFLDEAPKRLEILSQQTLDSAGDLDEAIAKAESDRERLREVYQIEELTAQITAGNEQLLQTQSDQLAVARAALETLDASGVQLNEAQQAARDRGYQALEDGRLTAQELAAFGEDFQTITASWQGSLGDLQAINARVMSSTHTLAVQVSKQKGQLEALESQMRDLQSRG